MRKIPGVLLGLAVLFLIPLPALAGEEAAPPAESPAVAEAAEEASPEVPRNVEAAAAEGNSCPLSLFQEPAEGTSAILWPPQGEGYCRCGCGVTCDTSADCGGGACVPYITCC